MNKVLRRFRTGRPGLPVRLTRPFGDNLRFWLQSGERVGRAYPLNYHRRGSTLIEVLISIAVVVLVLITVVSSGILVTKNRRFSTDQALATKYSQEGLEWAKAMRNTMGWQTFYDTVSAKGGPTVTFCMPTLPATTTAFAETNPGVCLATNVITGTPYLRSVTFVLVSSSEINIASYVDWTDNAQDHQTQTIAVLKEWQ